MDQWLEFFNQYESHQWIIVSLLGLFAGILGGLLGVGGGVILLPGLAIILGQNQHIYQAAAMISNVAVCIPAALRHKKAGVMKKSVLITVLPTTIIFILIGVYFSNLPIFKDSSGQAYLRYFMGTFMIYVIIINVKKVWPKSDKNRQKSDQIEANQAKSEQITPNRGMLIGGIVGSIAGLLGIGGGSIAVPLQQTILKIPLRSCIANSSAIIAVSAFFGAVYKNVSVETTSGFHYPGIAIALILVPGAIVGGRLGAKLTHILPLKTVRIIFILLLTVGAYKYLTI